eukprot:TRINITY_DN17502_c0_g1_i1.p1 TRINITY_DN17502_c0_g1~~TRINITY_DN17502_c0_g1_i1.p1  ORF type:complete len:296 (-),score=26.93 TRINITY_DN17502_c0_g1_i1:40-927(-)
MAALTWNGWLLVGSLLGVIFALTQTALLARKHLTSWNNPTEQTLTLVVLSMIPVYAVTAAVGCYELLHDHGEWLETLLDSVREVWEAVSLHCFMLLMLSFVEIDPMQAWCGTAKVPEGIKGREIHQSPPFSWVMSNLVVNAKSVQQITRYTGQFVILRPILSVLVILLQWNDLYDHWWFWLPVDIILNLSVALAVYGLLIFKHAFLPELTARGTRPVYKFWALKGVVFLAFWQGVVLRALTSLGAIHEGTDHTAAQLADGISDFLIAVEMSVIFAPLAWYAWSYKPYQTKKTKED